MDAEFEEVLDEVDEEVDFDGDESQVETASQIVPPADDMVEVEIEEDLDVTAESHRSGAASGVEGDAPALGRDESRYGDTAPSDTGAGVGSILEGEPPVTDAALTPRERHLAVFTTRMVVAEIYHLLRSSG